MKGKQLLNAIVEAQDLPSDLVQEELSQLLKKNHLASEEVNLTQLRELLADYLTEVFLGAKQSLNCPSEAEGH